MKMMQSIVSSMALLFVLMTQAAEPAEKVEAIVGRWRWMDRQVVECRADQTFSAKPTNRGGTWKRLEATSVEKKYDLKWDDGQFTDTLIMSRDGKKLSGKNQEGKRIEATRLE